MAPITGQQKAVTKLQNIWGEGCGLHGEAFVVRVQEQGGVGGGLGGTHLHQRDERGRVESVHLLLATLGGGSGCGRDGEMARWRGGKTCAEGWMVGEKCHRMPPTPCSYGIVLTKF